MSDYRIGVTIGTTGTYNMASAYNCTGTYVWTGCDQSGYPVSYQSGNITYGQAVAQLMGSDQGPPRTTINRRGQLLLLVN
jgi:hypothetical protein